MTEEILASGWTQAEIAIRLNKVQSWVSDIYRGSQTELKYNDAQALIQLHTEICNPAARSWPDT